MNDLFLVLPGVAAAAFLASVFGFGEALLLIPILSAVLGLHVTVPLVSLLTLVINAFILYKDRKLVRFDRVLWLLLAAGFAVPLGVWGLAQTDVWWFERILGALLLSFALYGLSGRLLPELRGRIWAFFFGGLAGALAGAYNISGPPIVLYAGMCRWDPSTFRASLQGFFAPLGLIVAVNHAYSGNYTPNTFYYFLWSLPALTLGIWLGNAVHRRLHEPARFQKYMYGLLAVLGTIFLIR